MNEPIPQNTRLNIFKPPNQTAILAGIIFLVLVGAVIAGSTTSAPIPLLPLAVFLVFLPFRNFLGWPDRELRKQQLTFADHELMELQSTIKAVSDEMGLLRVPRLVTTPEKIGLHVFGSFRRWFIAMNHDFALKLQADLKESKLVSARQAILFHELSHFKNGDYWQIGYTRELLQTTWRFMLWVLWFLFGYGIFLLLVSSYIQSHTMADIVNQLKNIPDEFRFGLLQIFPSDDAWKEMQEKAATINMIYVVNYVVSAILPFIVAGIAARYLYWPKLMRTREYYADARSVYCQDKSAYPLLSVLTKIPLKHFPKHYISSILPEREKLHWSLKELLDNHPKIISRIKALAYPQLIFDPWLITAVLIGSLVLLLDVLLASPMTLLAIGSFPMHFVTLSVFLLVLLSQFPLLITRIDFYKDIVKIIALVCVIRFFLVGLIILFMLVMLQLAPGTLDELLVAFVAAVAGSTSYSPNLHYSDLTQFVFEAAFSNSIQVVIVFVLLLVTVFLTVLIIRRVLTWYSFPNAETQLMKIIYAIIWIGAGLIAFSVLPAITGILLDLEMLLNPVLIGMAFLGAVVAGIGVIWFLRKDRQYNGICPNCQEKIPEPYMLGKTCSCGYVLNPWFIADYEV